MKNHDDLLSELYHSHDLGEIFEIIYLGDGIAVGNTLDSFSRALHRRCTKSPKHVESDQLASVATSCFTVGYNLITDHVVVFTISDSRGSSRIYKHFQNIFSSSILETVSLKPRWGNHSVKPKAPKGRWSGVR